VIGGAGGAIYGWLTGGDDAKAPTYTPNHQNFQYGLGPSDSYASLQSGKYDERQQQLAALGADAYNRQAPTQSLPDRRDFVSSQGQGYLTGADADARRQQIAALGGVNQSSQNLQAFADRPEGPSAAQAQLQAGQNAAIAQQSALARSQPGGGGAALRNAAFNAGGISAGVAGQAAQLRAQETQAYRALQLQALGGVQQGAGMAAGLTGQIRSGDQGFAQTQAGQANYDANAQNAYNAQQQQMQFNVGQNNQNAELTTRQQGDAMALGTGAQSMGYDAMRNQLASGQMQAGVDYEQARAQGAGLSSANFNAATQQSNTERAETYNMLSGALSTYAQQQGGGGKPTSDVRAKTDIKPTSVLEALGGKYTPEQTRQLYMSGLTSRYGIPAQLAEAHDANARSAGPDRSLGEFAPAPGAPDRRLQLAALGGPQLSQPDTAALDEAYRRQTGGEPNLRPAQGYEYSYKNPEEHGAGRYVGPMAQDLEHLPGVVERSPDGTKSINAPRLTLANTAAVSEQQRRLDELERRQQQLQALGGGRFMRPDLGQPDYGALDDAYARSAQP
jgi:hypothetical protein